MCPEADQINVVILRVIKYFAIRLAHADGELDIAQNMCPWGNSLLQTVHCLVIGSL
jgi:hypothetical protein